MLIFRQNVPATSNLAFFLNEDTVFNTEICHLHSFVSLQPIKDPRVPTLGFGYTLILSLRLYLHLPKGISHSGLLITKFLRIFHLSIHARCPADLVFLNVVVVVTYCVDI
jgi:hypothetical protein